MSVAEIRALPLEEKLQIMEALWEDLHPHFEFDAVSPELAKLLEARAARIDTGESKLLDWAEVRNQLAAE
ncbi:MAG: addiction module protein [Verrucomicrobia bacterium]|nr:addiction module protein [Verrucomicrobiota bacterium]